ncbi:MAG: signal peptidase I [Cyanothece sp. SIO1E1]|nr:signal peptidase I [Cyanothece sp. SIO1E1]
MSNPQFSRPFPSRVHRDPWLAINLSMLFPGIGQIYTNHVIKGILLATGQIVLIAIAINSIFAAQGNTAAGLGLMVLMAGIYIASLFDAYQCSSITTFIIKPGSPKLPWFAVLLSRILPGLGHLYLEKSTSGTVFLASAVIVSGFTQIVPQLFPIPPLIWAIGCYHAYAVSPQRQQHSKQLLLPIVMSIVVLGLAITYLPGRIHQSFERFIVPSESMLPTLQVNDQIFVHKFGNYRPQVGDVVVFKAPEAAINKTDATAETLFVKRVIATPGQMVEVKQGQILIEQQVLQEDYQNQPPAYEWGPKQVPPDAYFVLGDNRNSSADSHVWGFLPKRLLIGKAYKICWPPARVNPL